MINTQRRITEAEYRQLFGLSYPENTQNAQGGLTSRAQEALKYAHDIRKFEIRLYWTRAAYFWTFIVAALGGYGLVQEVQFRQPDLTAELSVVVGTLGFVFSLAWYCANRGSKRWQENWEKHVDLLEDAVIGPLYKIVFEPEEIEDPWYRPSGFLLRIERLLWGAGNFSVSKINQITSLFVTLLWSLMIYRALPPFDPSARIDWFIVEVLVLSFLASVLTFVGARTRQGNYRVTASKRDSGIESPGAPT